MKHYNKLIQSLPIIPGRHSDLYITSKFISYMAHSMGAWKFSALPEPSPNVRYTDTLPGAPSVRQTLDIGIKTEL